MKIFYIIMFSLCFIVNSYTQPRKAVNVNLLSFYEDWNIINNRSVSELSNIFSLGYYPEANTGLFVNAKYASVGGDVNSLSGFTDMQILAKHTLPKNNLSFNGGINIPSGKTKLTPDEFLTSQVISHDLFSLRTPGFGQGFNIFLGATWLTQLSSDFVFGAGLSYQIKGEYQPLKNVSSKYNPSNEISATAGFDQKLDQSSTLTGDITGIFYGSDELDGEEVFSSGTRIIANLLYRKYFDFDYLSVFALYRHVSISELEGIFAVLDNEKINPNQFYLSLSYSQRFSSMIRMEYKVFSNIFEKTISFYSGYTFLGIGINPEFNISPTLKIPVFLKYSVGVSGSRSSIQNLEIGIGLSLSF